MFLIDPQNEYGRPSMTARWCSTAQLKPPFWLFNFEEIVDVFFRGRPGVEEEVAIRRRHPDGQGKLLAGAADRLTLRKADSKSTGYTPDTPVPYRLADLAALYRREDGASGKQVVRDQV